MTKMDSCRALPHQMHSSEHTPHHLHPGGNGDHVSAASDFRPPLSPGNKYLTKLGPRPVNPAMRWQIENGTPESLIQHVESTYESVLVKLWQLTNDATDLKRDYEKLQTEYNAAKEYILYLEELLRSKCSQLLALHTIPEDAASENTKVHEDLVHRLEESERKCLVLRDELNDLREQNELLEFKVLESELGGNEAPVEEELQCQQQTTKFNEQPRKSEDNPSELQAKLDAVAVEKRLLELRVLQLEECLDKIKNDGQGSEYRSVECNSPPSTKSMALTSSSDWSRDAERESADCDMDEIVKAAMAEIESLECTLRVHAGEHLSDWERSSLYTTPEEPCEEAPQCDNLTFDDAFGHLLFLILLLYIILSYF